MKVALLVLWADSPGEHTAVIDMAAGGAYSCLSVLDQPMVRIDVPVFAKLFEFCD